MDDRILAILPARSGSERIKNKNIVDFIGRPIISYPIEKAKKCKLFDKIHVSTDSSEISEISMSLGADVSFYRQDDLCNNFTPIFPVLQWVLEEFRKRGEFFDTVFTIFPCSPLMSENDLTHAHDLYVKNGRKHSLMTMTEAPARSERYYKMNGDLLYMVRPEFYNTRTQDLSASFYEAGTFTIDPASAIVSGVRSGILGYRIPKWRSVDIDTEGDLAQAEIMYKILHG